MKTKKESNAGMTKKSLASLALVVWMTSGGAAGITGQNSPAAGNTEKEMTTTQSRFYCNLKALTPAEREHHKRLSEKLMAARKEIVETAKGYEFQYGPADVSLAELADWVGAESKCCPFFDFHIDVEREGKLLCLRLTGEEGIKAFIRAEFSVH
jgi:hypothetical protein